MTTSRCAFLAGTAVAATATVAAPTLAALASPADVVAVSKCPAVKFDYESELVLIIGKTARNVAESDALNYVFGYTTGNDVTARDPQQRVSQWMTGKTPDEFAPIGPWLVTADQILNPQTLQIQTWVNDEKTPQNANTPQMIFNCAYHATCRRFETGRPRPHDDLEDRRPALHADRNSRSSAAVEGARPLRAVPPPPGANESAAAGTWRNW